jgi:hypothetical protein
VVALRCDRARAPRRQACQPESRVTRDNYFEQVAPALRDVIARAVESDAVRGRSRVLLAAIYLTASWSRVGDRIYTDQVASIAKLPGDTDGSHCRRALRELAELGVIEYHGGRGSGRSSWISIRLSEDQTHPLMAPVRDDVERGRQWPSKGAASGPQKGAASGPLPRRGSEKSADDVGVDESEELERLLEPFKTHQSQRERFAKAYTANPAGFRLCVQDALNGRRPIALLDSKIANGFHHTAAPARRTPAPTCDSCGLGGGLHAADCDLVEGVA